MLQQALDKALDAESRAWHKVADLEDAIMLAGDTRTRILVELMKGPQFCKYLCSALGVDNKTANTALNRLEKEGKVKRKIKNSKTGLLEWSIVR